MRKILDIIMPQLIQQAKTDNIDRFVVAGIISKQEGTKILCLKRASHDFMPGLYELPSGKVEANEDILTSLKREIKEETNLDDIEITDYLSSFDYRSQSGKLTRQLNFIVQCKNLKTLTLSDQEHEGYTWLAAHEIHKYNISIETKKAIQGFFLRQNLTISSSQKIVDATHDGIERLVIGGIVSQNDKVLILKRASNDFMGGIYELPSGRLESGESIEMGIVRELKEETNLDVTGLGASLPHFDYLSASGKHTRQVNYEIRVNDTSCIKLSHEHEGFSWVQQTELETYPISKEVKNIIEHFLPKKSLPVAVAMCEQGVFKKRERGDEADANIAETKKINMNGGE